MEAKDLMIDDCVEYLDKYHIIKKINKIERSVGLWGKLIRDDIIVPTNTIEPIPLTPEILEKNGWEKRPTGYVFYTDGKRYDNSLWYIFDSNTFVVNTAEFQIKYAHELQHALRLCGIDKEIEL